MDRRRWLLAAWLPALCGCGSAPTGPRPPDVARPVPPPLREVLVPPAPQPPPPRRPGEIEADLGLAPGALKEQAESQAFRIDAGDTVAVYVRSHPRFTQEAVTIMPDGRLTLPGVGALVVIGMTVPELEAALIDQCRNAGLKNPAVTVTLKGYAKHFVTLVGIGNKSARVEIQGGGTLLETLAAAGWVYGDPRLPRVILIRQGRNTLIDLRDGYNLQNVNVNLRPDDIVMGLQQPPFNLRGQLNQNGVAAIPERGFVTLEEAIVLGGGVKIDADVEQARILRSNGQVERVNLNAYLTGKRRDEIRLFSGDELYVPASKSVGVYVFGMVPNPGLHRRPDRISLSQALAIAGHAQFGAKIHDIKLVRGYPAKPEVLTVDFERLAAGDAAEDLALQDGDVVYVPETTLSDVLDTVTRVLGPFSGSLSTAVQAMTVKKLAE